MAWDEYYGNEKPGKQLSMFEDPLYVEALSWRVGHADEWNYMVGLAHRCFEMRGWVPMKLLIENTRFMKGVGIKNALSPYLARIIAEENKDLKGAFKMHKSKADEVNYATD